MAAQRLSLKSNDDLPWTVSKDYELVRLVKWEPRIYKRPDYCQCDEHVEFCQKAWVRIGRRLRTSAGKCRLRWAYLLKRYKTFESKRSAMGRRTLSKSSGKALHPAFSFINEEVIKFSPCTCQSEESKEPDQVNKAKTKAQKELKPQEQAPTDNEDEQAKKTKYFLSNNHSLMFEFYKNQRENLLNCLRNDKKYKRLLNLI